MKRQFDKVFQLKKACIEYDYSIYDFLASEVFDLTTYDSGIDELFVNSILEVLRVIINRENFTYIQDQNNYIKYLLVCNLLERFDWIEWGTSIRGAWIECDEVNSKIICSHHQCGNGGINKIDIEIYATKENLIALVEWAESEIEKIDKGE